MPTPELAPERWLLTTRITTPQLGLEHYFSTPLAQRTLPLELTRLSHNDSGSDNNAFGTNALFTNVEGFFNNAHGHNALTLNTDSKNNAFGDLAMENNTSGSSNTAIGDDALRNNVDGSGNVAVGDEAGTGLGASVNNCIAIGAPGHALLLPLMTSSSSAASTVSRLATPAPRYQCMSINIT